MMPRKKDTGYSARLKCLLIIPLVGALLGVSTHAFAQGPPPPPPPPNPLNLFKKHKKDTTKKSATTEPSATTAPSGPSAQPAGPPPPPNPLNLFRKKKKDTTKIGKN
jgi:hypothetical protein